MKHAKRHPLIFGTLILTITGLITRIIGFFYRIYLSRLFGEEGMGIYQLLSPALSLSFSLTAAGYQTAISKFVAANTAGRRSDDLKTLLTGASITLPLSLGVNAVLFLAAEPIGTFLLKRSPYHIHAADSVLLYSFCRAACLHQRLFLWKKKLPFLPSRSFWSSWPESAVSFSSPEPICLRGAPLHQCGRLRSDRRRASVHADRSDLPVHTPVSGCLCSFPAKYLSFFRGLPGSVGHGTAPDRQSYRSEYFAEHRSCLHSPEASALRL